MHAKSMKKSPNKMQGQRNGLLALVHIAKKQLGLSDDEYREILGHWGASSAGALGVFELEDLVKYFESVGFKRKPCPEKKKQGQAGALRARIRETAAELENGEARLAGLVKSVCKVERLEWCRDLGTLRRLLKIIGTLRKIQDATRSNK